LHYQFNSFILKLKGNKLVNSERKKVKGLFDKLRKQPKWSFPKRRQPIDATSKQGVYIIRKGEKVLHVGRTLRGKGGLKQRLKNHLHGASSFTIKHFKGKGSILRRDGYTYQYLEVKSARERALLESYAIGTLCPKHIGLGK
jgi:hypothetical protein